MASDRLDVKTSKSTASGYKLISEFCNACFKRDVKLQFCARCGFVRYCSKECQTRDWASHSNFCQDIVDTMNPKDAFGLTTMLYDRTFGAHYSLFYQLSYKKFGPGVLLVELSHAGEAFAIPRGADANLQRNCKFTYVYKRPDLAKLSDDLKMCDPSEDGKPSLLEVMLKRNRDFCANLPPDAKNSAFSMVVRSPDRISLYTMVVWLTSSHPAVKTAVQGRVDLGNPFEIDYEVEDKENVVGSKFYAEIMATHRARAKAKGDERNPFHPRWGGLMPPLALHLNITQVREDRQQPNSAQRSAAELD